MLQQTESAGDHKNLLKLIKNYKTTSISSSLWQIANTFLPYVGLWILMIYAIQISHWLVIPLVFIAAGLTARLFIIFHDCGHGAFFKSKLANDAIGIFLGILTFTPYHRWHHAHLIHHRTAGNLDKRGIGDVWTLTVEEFNALSKKRQYWYRAYRNPIVMFLIGAPLMFLVSHRFTRKDFSRRERLSVYFTNLGLLVLVLGLSLLVGFKTFLLIQLPITYLASAGGVFLFYVQHQFPDVHWYRDEEWDYSTVAITGASYLKLPRVLQWFSGNIGFHHIHHLSSKIPNYKLERCHNENKPFQQVVPVKLMDSLYTLKLRLWDEKRQQLVSFSEAGV
ncbi:MAG TPA: fatty acid desaturase [Bacteroidales bacterium]|nr:fatty acid desaturase [Bacteroidales bacterium]